MARYLHATLCTWAWLLSSLGQTAFGQVQAPVQFGHTSWQTEQGLPQNTVQAILQTRDGYLWLGTKEGLARFDGLRFVVFDKQNTPQLPHNQIRGLFEDRAGRLWISTPGALVRLEHGRFTAFTTKDGLSSNNIWSVIEDHAGALWMATPNGLNRYREGQFTAFTTRDGLSHNSIETLLEDRTGALWVGTVEGLNRFKDGVFTRYGKPEGLAGPAIKALLEDQQGRVWIGTPDGLTVWADSKFQTFTTREGLAHTNVTTLTQDRAGRLWIGTPGGLHLWRAGAFTVYTTRQGLPHNRVEALKEDHQGGLWIGTPAGLAHWQDEALTTFTEREGLSSNLVLTLFEDREGNLWAGTEAGGLNLIKHKKFTTYTTRQGLSANLVRSIFEDRAGNLWVGTQAGLNRMKDGRWTTFTTKDGLASNDVLALCDDRQGNLWLGTPQGLQRFRQGRFTTFTVRDGLADDYIRSLYEDRAGTLWIGTRRGLVRWQNGQFTVFTMLDGLANDLVGALCEGRDGSLWIGTLGGLSRFKDGQFTNYVNELSSEVVIALHEDASGVLWIGTHGGGLNRYKDGRFTHFTAKDGLSDDVIYQILEDSQDNLWMSSNKGIMRVSRQDLEARRPGAAQPLPVISYGTADGMETRECSGGGHPAGSKTRDGRLWFATIKGIAQLDPANLRVNTLPPPVTIEQVIVDDTTFQPGAPLELPPGQKRFEFYYTGFSFAAPQQVKFKYKLEGFDPAWIDAGTRRMASYTNVPAGRYRFRVLACNNDGVWNETGASFEFYHHPYFYRTYWFYGLCLLSLGAALFAWNRARLRRVEREFAAVLAERTRIAREIHDTLAQGFAGISVQLELVARLLERAPATAKTHLDQARELVRDSLAEARRSVWDLRSPSLEDTDLPAALAETAKRLVAGTHIQAHVEVSGTYRPLSRTAEAHLLRIGQEAMTNALKHARATQLNIHLEFETRRLRFSVRDNGCGFDTAAAPASRTGHFGLVGIRERVEQLGGKLNLQSRPNEGTELTIEVPLNG
jgi:ligand-binding sensor domain-containing protein/signal transduction histidine kinase